MGSQTRRAAAERRVALAQQVVGAAQRKLAWALATPARSRQQEIAVMAARIELNAADVVLRKARRVLREAAAAEPTGEVA